MLTQVYAQVSTVVASPIAIGSLSELFNWVINLILAVGFSLVIIMLAMGFIRYIMSQGDKTSIETAQKWVTYAAIGGVGLFLVFAIKNVLNSVAGNNLNPGSNLIIGG